MKSVFKKIIFVILAYFIWFFIIISNALLKVMGKLKETDLEPFPRETNMILVMNHPDGNEWFFIYRRFFRPIYLIAPWLMLKLPRALADRINFYSSNPFLRLFALVIIPVDRKARNSEAESSIKQCLDLLKKGGVIIGFFEGTRTRKATEKLYSEKKRKVLGRLDRSVGVMIRRTGAALKPGWIEYSRASFSSLPENGRFSFRRFFSWYIRTLFGQNGKIVIIWGKLERLENQRSGEVTSFLEKKLLELGDKV